MSPAAQQCVLADEEATTLFGATLARLCKGHGVIALRGNLGSGKTTLCRGLIRALGHTGAVKSPTFTLVEPYDLPGCRVQHYDLYRLADPEEVEYLGMRDFIDSSTLTLIEWPERAAGLLPPIDLDIALQVLANGRLANWQGHSAYGQELATALARQFSSFP
jgi:tRNA threonylcarbamoyladenosine biosynthesis protein TsaE